MTAPIRISASIHVGSTAIDTKLDAISQVIGLGNPQFIPPFGVTAFPTLQH